MILTALIDNTRLENRADLAVERGLSLHIETNGLELLKIENVDAAVISHRHYDHCNGVTHFLDKNSKAQVYFRECKETNY